VTWLFTQVWLWSLAAFLLGSVFTWLLFVRPLRRRLNAVIAEFSHYVDSADIRQGPKTDHPRPLDLFEPEPANEETSVDGSDHAVHPWELPQSEWHAAPQVSVNSAQQVERARTGFAVSPPEFELGEPADESTADTEVTAPAAEGEISPADTEIGEPSNVANTWFQNTDADAEWADDLVASPKASNDPDRPEAVTQRIPIIRDERRSVSNEGSSAASSDGYVIKGHFASRQYHTPDSPQYERVVAEVWFRTVADAEQAGFESWDARPPE
jgi:hypothetical protein